LASAEPAVYEANLAATLNNLGNVLRNLRQLEQAREAYARALAIYERLASAEPAVYEADVAMTLNNLGTVLSDLRQLEQAREAYARALAIYERLASPEPAVYEADVAEVLVNYSRTLEDLGERGRSIELVDRLVARARRCPDAFDAARHLDSAGMILIRNGRFADAGRLFAESLPLAERALAAIPAAEGPHLHLHKRQLETTLRHGAADAVRRNGNGHAGLFALLEALRRAEARIGDDDSAPAPHESPHRAEKSSPSVNAAVLDAAVSRRRRLLADQLESCRAELATHDAAMLYVQPTPQQVVFWLVDGRTDAPAAVAPCRFARLMNAAFLTLMGRRTNGAAPGRQGEAVDAARLLLGQAWAELPAAVRRVFSYPDRPLWISSHGQANRWPFELLGDQDAPVGLGHVLPRIGSMEELCAVLNRTPMAGRSMVIGAPSSKQLVELPFALASSEQIAGMLPPDDRKGEAERPIMKCRATLDVVAGGLNADDLSFFMFTGHGGWGDQGAELALAGTERLAAGHLSRPSPWPRRPWIHFDCCFGAAAREEGGGRRLGLIHAALDRGASAVLASSHALGDADAARFAEVFYGRWLGGEAAAGEALLEARRELYENPVSQPFFWCLPILHGNALARSPYGPRDVRVTDRFAAKKNRPP
jgi:tetratricopeptide (TPR) repeat protein